VADQNLVLGDEEAKAVQETAKAVQEALRTMQGMGSYLRDMFGTAPAVDDSPGFPIE
jgi:hypothetical protein